MPETELTRWTCRCGKPLNAPVAAIGQLGKCRACGKPEIVPRPAKASSRDSGKRVASILAMLRESSVLEETFCCYVWYATRDTRVRPDHWALDRKAAYRNSSLGRYMESVIEDEECRCNLVLITEDDALARGISPGGEQGT